VIMPSSEPANEVELDLTETGQTAVNPLLR
jgi:hypothetical protein